MTQGQKATTTLLETPVPGGLWIAFTATLKRDVTLMFRRRGELFNPLVFFALVITLFPIGISPDRAVLR